MKRGLRKRSTTKSKQDYFKQPGGFIHQDGEKEKEEEEEGISNLPKKYTRTYQKRR